MRPSLRFAMALLTTAAVCAAASIAVLTWQDQQQTRDAAEHLAGGSASAGKLALRRYGCGGCHRIQGVDGAAGVVGPSLNDIAIRGLIAGRLSNRPDNLIRWIRVPQEIDPGNGMPDLGISERDARDMAAYLYTLK